MYIIKSVLNKNSQCEERERERVKKKVAKNDNPPICYEKIEKNESDRNWFGDFIYVRQEF